MLLAQAQLATSFPEDFFFYHHAQHPYIQSLRKRFIKELSESKPEFIIEVKDVYKYFFEGSDVEYNFPELTDFLQNNYEIRVNTKTYIIYGKK